MSSSTRRMYARRRRTILLAFLLVTAMVLIVGRLIGDDGDPVPTAVTVPPAQPTGGARPAGSAAARPPAARTAKARTEGRQATGVAPAAPRTTAADPFEFAGTAGPVLGVAGPLRRFKIAVEIGAGPDAGEFAVQADRILGDPRSWIAGRQYRLQRVPPEMSSEFTVILASAATSERMCAAGGLQTARYTSCRLPGQVIMNVDRWKVGIPSYGAPLATYQAYALNHEVGHQLGHGHEACPGEGRQAPVMQQQTYGLKGCTANAWPYVHGKRYAGAPVD